MSRREIHLGDAFRVKHGFAFKSQYFTDDGEHVVLTPGNFNEKGGFRLRPGKDRFYTGDIPEDYLLEDRGGLDRSNDRAGSRSSWKFCVDS